MKLRSTAHLLALSGFVMAGTAQAQVNCSQYQDSVAVDKLVQLSYVVNVEDTTTGQGTLTAELVYADLAWVGFGFSQSGLMFPSKAIVGLPDASTVQKYDLASYDISGILPSSAQTLENVSIRQNATHTILRFTKLLVESGELTIDGSGSNNFIWAYGTDNTFGYHRGRGTTSLSLTSCSSQASSPTPVTTSTTPAPTVTPTTAPTLAAQVPTLTNSSNTSALDCSGFQQQVQLTDGLVLSYTATLDAIDPTNGILYAQLVYSGQAWLGLGFSTSNNGAMVPADAIIGLPAEAVSLSNPGKYTMTSRSLSGVTLLSDSRQTLVNQSIVQNATHTVVTFAKVLIEANEVPIVLDQTTAFIWAIGYSNTLGVHKSRGAIGVTLRACIPGQEASSGNGVNTISSPSNYKSFYSAHGILAGIAWGIFSPIAIGCSVLRDLIPKAGLWFKIHMFLNMSVFLFTVISFIVAVTAEQKGTVAGESPQHFKGNTHRTVGLVIMICVSLQVLGGMLRPHAPGKKENGEPEDKPFVRLFWELIHKGSGYGLLATAWWQVQSGLKLYSQQFATKDLSPVFWGIAAGIGGLVALLYFYSKCKTKQKKLVEEDEPDGV